jgi:ribosome biogenesis GTPase
MRELQLSNAASGLADFFDDIVALAQTCRFSNCAHEGEPACALQGALKDGTLSVARLDRWRTLVAEDALNTREMDEKKSVVRQVRKRR